MCLDGKTLHLLPQAADLGGEITGLVRVDAGRNDRAAHTTGTAQRDLARDENVGDVLVLGEQGQVHDDGQRGGVSGEHDDLGDTAVDRLGGQTEKTRLERY